MRLATALAILALGLPLAATAVAQPASPAASVSVVQVVDAATLDVGGNSSVERVHVLGIEDEVPSCVAQAALARTHELVDGQTVRLEVDPGLAAQDQAGQTQAYVWLPDDRSLGQVLLSEGLVRARIAAKPYQSENAYTAAQADAMGQRLGLWAPETCPPLAPPAGLAPYVRSMLDQTQVASTALSVLHQQALTATAYAPALEEPAWRQSTAYALAELQTAAALLTSSPVPSTVAPLAQRLALAGNDVNGGAAAYSQALVRQDAALVGATDNQLQATAASLLPLQRELVAVAAMYQFGD